MTTFFLILTVVLAVLAVILDIWLFFADPEDFPICIIMQIVIALILFGATRI